MSTCKSTVEGHKGEKSASTENEPGETVTDGGPSKDVGAETLETNLGRTRRISAGDPIKVSKKATDDPKLDCATTELLGAGKSSDAVKVAECAEGVETGVKRIAADVGKRKTHTCNPGEPPNDQAESVDSTASLCIDIVLEEKTKIVSVSSKGSNFLVCPTIMLRVKTSGDVTCEVTDEDASKCETEYVEYEMYEYYYYYHDEDGNRRRGYYYDEDEDEYDYDYDYYYYYGDERERGRYEYEYDYDYEYYYYDEDERERGRYDYDYDYEYYYYYYVDEAPASRGSEMVKKPSEVESRGTSDVSNDLDKHGAASCLKGTADVNDGDRSHPDHAFEERDTCCGVVVVIGWPRATGLKSNEKVPKESPEAEQK